MRKFSTHEIKILLKTKQYKTTKPQTNKAKPCVTSNEKQIA